MLSSKENDNKKFYHIASFNLEQLCKGLIGLVPNI